jgi:uncharacterized protein
MAEFVIERILIYPVRSLGGMTMTQAEITPAGSLLGDREWVVVRPDGSLLWQGDIPRMTLLSASLVDGELAVRGHDGALGPRPKDGVGGVTTVRQDGYSVPGTDQGDDIAQWLSAQLEAPCRLVRTGAEAHRWGGLNPIHAVSLVSLAALNERLVDQGYEPVEVERFRPNVVFSGRHDAFDEERVETIEFDGASLLLREPCVRCELPNISRVDASRGKQPLKLIGAMSRNRPSARPASFGTYCAARGEVLRSGMASVRPGG